MTHYAHIFTINRLLLPVHLGYYEAERNQVQSVAVDLRIYFPQQPACANNDHAPFIDYGIITQAVSDFASASARQFYLIEFLATELFKLVRGILDTHGHGELKLWLRLTKCSTPIKGLVDGASYVTSDLPANATFPPPV